MAIQRWFFFVRSRLIDASWSGSRVSFGDIGNHVCICIWLGKDTGYCHAPSQDGRIVKWRPNQIDGEKKRLAMTVIYDNKNHLRVIFQIQGSIWPEVLPLCLFNAVVTILIFMLRERGVMDLHFDGGKGMQYISVLVSFFVVSSIGTTYNRYWEARAYVGKALLSASLLADRAAIYSASSQSEKAQLWRNALQHRLSQLVNYSMHIIQNERGALINIITTSSEKHAAGGEDTTDALLKKHGLRRTFVANHIGLLEEKESHGGKLASWVDAIIQSNDKYLDHPLVIHEKMDLLSKTSAFLDAFHALIKFSTTPVPFVTVQMGRTITFAWILFLPFVIISDPKSNLWEATAMVFLVTYGFAGLLLAEVEMHDPLGHDDNDIETDRYTKFILEDIAQSLGPKGHSSEDFFASAFALSSEEEAQGELSYTYDSIV